MTTPNRALLASLAARLTVPGLRLAGDVAGLACLVAAAWIWHAGLGALGLALLVLAARNDR
jgi:hypothetical protein